MMETQYIRLNMVPSGIIPIFNISQYDVGRKLGFYVHIGAIPVDLDNYTCTIEATRKDGVAIITPVETSNNVGTFEVTATMSNIVNRYLCQLVLVNENSKRVASLPFYMNVIKAAMDENAEAIEEDATLYQQYTDAMQSIIAETKADIVDEATERQANIDAEIAARQDADNTLQANIETEISNREQADNTLQTNIDLEKTIRQSADTTINARIDNIVAPSGGAPSAAEVTDARVGVDGITYNNLGTAIRTQIGEFRGDINGISIPITWTDGSYLKADGTTATHADFAVSDYIDVGSYGVFVFSAEIVDSAAVVLFDSDRNRTNSYTNPQRESPFVRRIENDRVKYIRLCTKINKKGSCFLLPMTNPRALTSTTLTYMYENMPTIYKDADNLPVNRTFVIRFNWNNTDKPMTHYPYEGFAGTILTVNTDNSGEWGFQIATKESSSGDAQLYFRTRWQTWSEWKRVFRQQDFANIITTYPNTSYNNMPQSYLDANTLPANTVVGYHSTWAEGSELGHAPFNPFTGTIVTLNTVYDMGTFGIQIAYEERSSSHRMFYRTRYVNWGDWIEVGSKSDILKLGRTSKAYRGLGDFVLCGDSLSVSLSYKGAGMSKRVKSWGTILAEMMNSSCEVYAQGGIATGGFLASSLYANAVANQSQFAIVYLGTNDANNNVSEESFKTNYKQIVNGLLQNHQFVFCVNLPSATSPDNRDTYNTIIQEVCSETSHVYFIDVAKYQDFFEGFKNWGHLSSVGYAAFAEAISWAIDETMLAYNYFDANIDFPES